MMKSLVIGILKFLLAGFFVGIVSVSQSGHSGRFDWQIKSVLCQSCPR